LQPARRRLAPQARIFEPFFIVEQNGGHIWAYSQGQSADAGGTETVGTGF
jgi:hypothetical protein